MSQVGRLGPPLSQCPHRLHALGSEGTESLFFEHKIPVLGRQQDSQWPAHGRSQGNSEGISFVLPTGTVLLSHPQPNRFML